MDSVFETFAARLALWYWTPSLCHWIGAEGKQETASGKEHGVHLSTFEYMNTWDTWFLYNFGSTFCFNDIAVPCHESNGTISVTSACHCPGSLRGLWTYHQDWDSIEWYSGWKPMDAWMPKDAYNIDSIVFRKMNQMVRLLRQDL